MKTYRKCQNGCEFLLINDSHLISVLKTNSGYRIMATNNSMIIKDAHSPELSMESSKEEFDRHFYEASVYITKYNQ